MKLLCSIKALHCLFQIFNYTNETLNTKYILVFIERDNIYNIFLSLYIYIVRIVISLIVLMLSELKIC